MTLVIRLFIVGVLGIGLFFGYLFYGEPKLRAMAAQEASTPTSGETAKVSAVAALFGQYRAASGNGSYVLVLTDKGAQMNYTDKKGKQYAYRGHYTVDGDALLVEWAEQRNGSTWAAMNTYKDNMTIAGLDGKGAHVDALNAPERAFRRVQMQKSPF